MKSIEAIKERARSHELDERWQEALDLYLKAIRELDGEEDIDIGLFNRVGDLEVRMGKVEAAVEHYERAVDLYMESELPNNAIAVCKKVVRNLPSRHSIYLKMGQIRASQGFLTDARQNFLNYAEQMQVEGDMESAFRALIEFVEVAPGDIEIRLALADQLAQHDRIEEAVEQFKAARRRLILDGRDEEGEAVASKLEELAPGEELTDAEAIRLAGPEEMTTSPEEPDEWAASLSTFSFSDEEEEAEADEAEAEEISAEDEEDVALEEEPAAAGDVEEEGEPLPTFGYGYEGGREAEEEAVDADAAESVEEAAEEAASAEEAEPAVEEEADDWLAAVDVEPDVEPEVEPDAEPDAEPGDLDPESLGARSAELRAQGRDDEADDLLDDAHQALAEAGRMDGAVEVLELLIEEHPDTLEFRQRLVEYAYRTSDDEMLVSAYQGLANLLREQGENRKAKAVYQQVLDSDPGNEEAVRAIAELEGREEPEERREVASSEEYVDLGSMVLDEEEEERSTRFQVAAEAPSGDEEADFAKMLGQFKKKVAENVGTDDLAAHYDLGTAYKEMGLVDEAIGEFQDALRAARDHLPTYEMLGQCFLEKDQHEAAARTLKKALDAPFEVEDELLGIYYFLGRAYEGMEEDESAVEYYDKVFELDINFMDVTERLRNLR